MYLKRISDGENVRDSNAQRNWSVIVSFSFSPVFSVFIILHHPVVSKSFTFSMPSSYICDTSYY